VRGRLGYGSRAWPVEMWHQVVLDKGRPDMVGWMDV